MTSEQSAPPVVYVLTQPGNAGRIAVQQWRQRHDRKSYNAIRVTSVPGLVGLSADTLVVLPHWWMGRTQDDVVEVWRRVHQIRDGGRTQSDQEAAWPDSENRSTGVPS